MALALMVAKITVRPGFSYGFIRHGFLHSISQRLPLRPHIITPASWQFHYRWTFAGFSGPRGLAPIHRAIQMKFAVALLPGLSGGSKTDNEGFLLIL
jgi:hypothetical protein